MKEKFMDSHKLKVQIGDRVKSARIKKFGDSRGSQKKAADFIGVSAGQLGDMEAGRGQPRIDTLAKYAQAFDVSLWELIKDTEANNKAVENNPNDYLINLSHELFPMLLEQLTVVHRAAIGSGKNLRVWVGFLKWLTEILRERGVDALPQEAPAPERDSA